MTKILNCASVETAKQSIAEIFEISTLQLEDFFISLGNIYQPHIQENYVYEMFSQQFGNRSDFEVMYFHGTRIANIDSFLTQGILPLNEVVQQIENDLTQLAKEHQIELTKPFSFLSNYTQRPKDEPGPMGFLIRDFTKSNESGYTKSPEVIADLITSSVLLAQQDTFKRIFEANYTPSVIWFIAPLSENSLKYALWYAYTGSLDPDGPSYIDAPFDGFGKFIPPEKIYKIEKIDP